MDFEEHRSHLTAVAYRMLGSVAEAEDAVQEAWLRLARSDVAHVSNPRGWLTTVVARICLDQLRSRRESPVAVVPDVAGVVDVAEDAALADSVGRALLVVLDTLAPAERVAFVLHDLFAVPFEEVAVVLDRSPAAARQLASRARRRVRGASSSGDVRGRRAVVEAFLAAARGGDLGALVALLDPDVVVRADSFAVASGAAAEVRGSSAVAAYFSGRAQAARVAEVDGVVQAVWSSGGQVRMVFAFTLDGDRVVRIDLVADPDRLASLRCRMDRDALVALQAPLKDRYRAEPAAALVTLSASGSLGENVSCSVATGQALAEAGLHPATGGDGMLACSGDMLLQALVACAGVTLRAVATSLEIPVDGGTVRAEGDLDFRGTLAVSKEAPVGFTAIRVTFSLETSAADAQVADLLRLTERYCVVYQTLAGTPALSLGLA